MTPRCLIYRWPGPSAVNPVNIQESVYLRSTRWCSSSRKFEETWPRSCKSSIFFDHVDLSFNCCLILCSIQKALLTVSIIPCLEVISCSHPTQTSKLSQEPSYSKLFTILSNAFHITPIIKYHVDFICCNYAAKNGKSKIKTHVREYKLILVLAWKTKCLKY